MLDSSQIESQIDSSFPDNTTRQIKPTGIRVFLKTLVRWVRDAVNNNQTTWVRSSDGQPGGANTDDISRTGVTRFKGGIEAYTRTPDNKPLAQVGNDLAAMRVSSQNGGPAYIELHHPGNRIDKLGTDQNGVLGFGPWGVPTSYAIFISGLTPLLALPTVPANRKVVLYDGGNEHQFYGFGVNADTLRYQVLQATANHVFYAGSSPVTSVELMRIAGNGNVSIGDTTAQFRLKVVDNNPGSGWILVVSNARPGAGRTGAKILFDQNNLASWAVGQPGGDIDAFVIESSGSVERVRIDAAGNMGVGTTAPTARLHAKGPSGFDQLRLENKYTPTGPGDPNGQVGTFAWDDAWFYLKTTNGWRRMQLQGW